MRTLACRLTLALALVLATACGSGGGSTTLGPPLTVSYMTTPENDGYARSDLVLSSTSSMPMVRATSRFRS